MLDVAVLVPLQAMPGSWVDPAIRSAFGATRLVTSRAKDRLFEALGVAPGVTGDFGHRERRGRSKP